MLNVPVDEYLFYPDPFCIPLVFILKKLFEEVEYIDTSYSQSIFIRARKPFAIDIIDGVSYFDICPGDNGFPNSAWSTLVKEDCYYTGPYSHYTFVVSEDGKSLRYVPKKQT